VRGNKQITQPDGSALTLLVDRRSKQKKMASTRLTRSSRIKAGKLLIAPLPPSSRAARTGRGGVLVHHGNRPAPNQPNRIGVGGVFEIEAGRPKNAFVFDFLFAFGRLVGDTGWFIA
jgi:hypothetical protein